MTDLTHLIGRLRDEMACLSPERVVVSLKPPTWKGSPTPPSGRRRERLTVADILQAADALQSLTARVEELEEAEAWRPIETAPKDGAKILLWFLDEIVVGKWSPDYHWWYGNNVKWFDGQQLVTALQDGLGQGGPTHWRPLPQPPARALNPVEGE